MNLQASTEFAQTQRRWRPYPEYKQSGVEWLGKIPVQWEVKRVKFITTTHKQGYYTEQAYVDDGVKLARITDIDDFGNVSFKEMPFVDILARDEGLFSLRDGDFLFARSGTIGRFGLVRNPERSVFASYLIRFRFKSCEPDFLRYVFSSDFFRESLISQLHGGANQNIHAENIKELLLTIPSPVEQHDIAYFLDRETAKIDALLKKKERLIELLQEKRVAIISQAVTKGLDTNIPLKESGTEWLGKIPVHWEVKRLKQTVPQRPGAIKTGPFGSQLLASEMIEGEVKVYNQENVIGKDLSYGENYISEAKFEELRAFAVAPGDVLLTTRGTIGRCVILPDNAEPGILHPCLMRIQPDSRKLLAKFLTYLIQDSTLVQTQIFLLSNATTIAVIYSETMRNVVVALPPIEEQQRIVDFLDRETAKIDTLVAKIRKGIEKLKEYRTALISAAVTGKIDVREERAFVS